MSDAFQRVLALLPSARKQGDNHQARCPAHDDSSPSLSISEGRDGRVLFKCHRGCEPEAIVRALGLEMGDLFERDTSRSSGRGDRIAATYDYTDENGALLFQVVRFDPKDFRQRRPDGRGGFEYSIKDTRRVLYHLRDVLAAATAGKVVFIPEGEKDVDALRSLGLHATTNAGGAGKWRDEYAASLTGAHVVLLPDNDDVGRKHARDVASRIAASAKSVRLLELPNLPEKGDVSDWLGAGGTAEQLRALATDAPPWTPSLTSTADTTIPSEDALPLATCSLAIGPAEPIKWAIKGLWTAGDIGVLFGDGGSSKTTVALHIACAVAGGYRVFNHFETEKRPALFISEEDPAAILNARAEAMIEGHGWSRETVKANLHFLALNGAKLTNAAWQAHLRSEVERLNVGIVVLDPLTELHDGDENSATEMQPVVAATRSLSLATGAMVMWVHHAGKAADGKRAIDRIRGSSKFFSAARMAYFCDMSDGTITLTCLKLNRAVKPAPFVVRTLIETDPTNPATWTLARFDYATAQEFQLDAAEKFVLEQLEGGARMTTSALRDAPDKPKGVNNPAVSKALKMLEMRGLIDFEQGGNNAKLWGLARKTETPEKELTSSTSLPTFFGQAGQPDNSPSQSLPGRLNDCPGKLVVGPQACLTPIGGQAWDTNDSDVENLGRLAIEPRERVRI